MSERTVAPCPTCGGAGILVFEPSPGGVLWHVHCESDACLVGERQPEASEALASWNRLSRAARLLRAVEGLGERTLLFESSGLWWVSQRSGTRVGSGATPVDAFVALAAEVGHA